MITIPAETVTSIDMSGRVEGRTLVANWRLIPIPRPSPTIVPSSPYIRPSAISSPRTRRTGSPNANNIARSRTRSSALMLAAL